MKHRGADADVSGGAAPVGEMKIAAVMTLALGNSRLYAISEVQCDPV